MPIRQGRTRIIAVLLLIATAAAQNLKNQPTVYAGKPDIAAFEKKENDRLAAAQKSIDQIVAVKGARTIDNTLEPYDEAIRMLNAAAYFSVLMQQVHPDAAYRDHATAMTTKVSSAQTALSLNQDVYHALAALDVSKADPATKYYVQRQLLEFRLSGVDKDEATRAKIKKLQDELTDHLSAFDRNISDDVRTVEVSNVSELDGLPQDYIDNHKPGPDGKIKINTTYPDLVPVMTFAKSDQLRRELWEAFDSRAYPKNRDVLKDIMRCRYELARLIGYPSWADYNAADKMIQTGGNIAKFIDQVNTAARPIAEREFKMQLAEKRKTDPTAKEISSYESRHLAELVRRSQYDFNSESVRPYLPYDEVKQGIMNTAAALFRVSFQQEPNSDVWDSSVETWDVMEHGKAIGRFYLDMHPRPGKYSHAQMSAVLDGVRGKQLPEAILICNFPKPTATDPALMDYSDATTFFHEFGHLMHHILGGQQQWAGISGISMESDFVEAPSQMLEEWMRSPQVLASFARNYKTGEPIPADLVARMDRASAFGRGNWVSGQNGFSAISYDIYKDDPKNVDLDSVTFHDLQLYTSYIPIPADAHLFASFNHLGGYSSAYYTYLWDKVIAIDFYRQFDQHNLLAGDTPMRYRREVLEPGGSMSANDLVKNFLGRPQNMQAFQEWMGEEFKDAPQSKISGAP